MSVVSIENSSSYGELIRGVGVQFQDVYNQRKMTYSKAIDNLMAEEGNKATRLCRKEKTNAKIVHYLQRTGTAYPSVFGEGSSIPVDTRLMGYKTSLTIQDYGLQIPITDDAMMDNDYQGELNAFGDLGVSMEELQDKWFFDLFNNAFTAQASLPNYIYGYGDGKPLASTLHPRKDGGTAQSNASSTGLVFNNVNFATARNALARQLDDRGKPIDVGSSSLILLVPTELQDQACEFAKSEKKINTNNNNINVWKGMVTVVSSKLLAYSGANIASTAWFVIDTKVAQLRMYERQASKSFSATDKDTLNKFFAVKGRAVVGWTDWRGVWASKGDGGAYSS